MSRTLAYKGTSPILGTDVYIAQGAVVIGDVVLGDRSSIWFGCVLRGDVNSIRIGEGSNIQDATVIHVTGHKYPTTIGRDVTVGHKCILHGCTLADGSFVGMGSTVMDGVVVETGAMVAAGSLVTPRKVVKSGELWSGSPARLMRRLSDEEIAGFIHTAEHYVELAKDYLGDKT